MPIEKLRKKYRKQESGTQNRTWVQVFHLDIPLLAGLFLLCSYGLIILYSAGNQQTSVIYSQVAHIILALVLMLVLAQIPPWLYQRWTPIFYCFSLFTLVVVMVAGHVSLGAQRWINLGFIRFQPTDLMRIAIPMMLAWYFSHRELPPSFKEICVACVIIVVPAAITAKQPDLGSAIILMASGACVLVLAGMRWRLISAIITGAIISTPFLWHYMHQYQKQRVLTFLNPARDPLGSGYHIIQSKIAIGSGGIMGKGWLAGTQSHLNFIPEHATDFIFAVCGEEFGFIGGLMLLALCLILVFRCLFIASQAQDTYTRLLAGSISIVFFLSVFINIGMVTGLLPVVGLPLPLVSYGGTSMLTLLAGFGILMSIQSHKRLL